MYGTNNLVLFSELQSKTLLADYVQCLDHLYLATKMGQIVIYIYTNMFISQPSTFIDQHNEQCLYVGSLFKPIHVLG